MHHIFVTVNIHAFIPSLVVYFASLVVYSTFLDLKNISTESSGE